MFSLPSHNTNWETLKRAWQPSDGQCRHSLQGVKSAITSAFRANFYQSAPDRLRCSGELLLDQQRFQDAVEKFDRAIQKSEIEVAITWFEKQVQMARGEAEITAALTYLKVCRDAHVTTR